MIGEFLVGVLRHYENEAFLQSLLTLRAKGERSAFPELLRVYPYLKIERSSRQSKEPLAISEETYLSGFCTKKRTTEVLRGLGPRLLYEKTYN